MTKLSQRPFDFRREASRPDGATAHRSRGFTLVELMVAVVGGLIVSIVVFALARDGSRFYRHEARIADAMMSTLIGFDRLRADIARAGFLSTPNVYRDPMFCGSTNQIANWPAQMQRLASIEISDDTTAGANAVLNSAGIVPQELVLSGAYDSVERFPAVDVQANVSGSGYLVTLQSGIGPLARLDYANAVDKAQILAREFPTGRALRIVNETGRVQFGRISGTDATSAPVIQLADQPALNLPTAGTSLCTVKGTATLVNVVNFIRYRLVDVIDNTSSFPGYSYLFASAADNPYEANRLELMREELDVTGAPLSQEIVAEYAIDLQFGLTEVQLTGGSPTSLLTHGFRDPEVTNIAGVIGNNQTQHPQLVRTVRARLSVRSRDPDREGNVTAGGSVAAGLYRIGLGTANTTPFARVRTLQSDIFIPRQADVTWQ